MTIEVVALFAILFALLACGVWIGLTLALTATLLLAMFRMAPPDRPVVQDRAAQDLTLNRLTGRISP